MHLTPYQLAGLDDTHLTQVAEGQRLQAEVARQLARLQADARAAGFELAIASSFRSFERQLLIWNGKACGQRPVYDDAGKLVDIRAMGDAGKLAAIMRFSAIPGTSRHHWGTDLDVFDAAAMPAGYQLQLSAAEVADNGLFGAMHGWLDERMAAGESHGFFRPYAVDRGGVAVERWHLSYAPASLACAAQLNDAVLREVWDGAPQPVLLRDEIERELAQLKVRYLDVPAGWCPEFPPGS
jgi:LAS superfamily LD-carboxypeptidase LdcB